MRRVERTLAAQQVDFIEAHALVVKFLHHVQPRADGAFHRAQHQHMVVMFLFGLDLRERAQMMQGV